MSKFRTKIILSLSILVLTVLVGLGFLLGQLFKSFYNNTFEERMEKEANLIAFLIEDQVKLNEKNLENWLRDIETRLSANITIISPNGKIDRKTDSAILPELYSNIPRLKQLIDHKQTEFDGFHVMSERDGFFYYVMPLKVQNTFKGYLVLSLTVDPLKNINQKIWALLVTSFGIACILILILGTRITDQYMKPIESATRVANELAKGNYKSRTYEDHIDETGMLSRSINILARNLQQMTAAQEMQQDRLRTLIESMGSGLILIDGKGYINLVNWFYKEIFDVEPADYLYRLYYDAFKHKEVAALVEKIFMTEKPVREQLHLPLKIERRHFEVYGAPIIGNNKEWKGVVLVFHDITELKKLEQMRKDFVANVSHELKTPITSIKGFSETLLDGAMEDQKLREYFLNIILKETDRLQSLIKDLLDLSKIEQESFEIHFLPVDLKETLEEVVVILKSKAEEKQIDLQCHIDNTKLFMMEGDPYRLKQIFINLINNAINYSLPKGRVDISCIDLGDKIRVDITDNGVGISKDQIPRIFERFYRVDKDRSRNSGGTGLGLAIVKHLVEAHHGKINVKSEVNKGTTFSVIFSKYRLTNR